MNAERSLKIIAAATGAPPVTSASMTDPATGLPYGSVNPATGMPYGAINPATGRPYGEIEEPSYVPFVIGALVIVGVGAVRRVIVVIVVVTCDRASRREHRGGSSDHRDQEQDLFHVTSKKAFGASPCKTPELRVWTTSR